MPNQLYQDVLKDQDQIIICIVNLEKVEYLNRNEVLVSETEMKLNVAHPVLCLTLLIQDRMGGHMSI